MDLARVVVASTILFKLYVDVVFSSGSTTAAAGQVKRVESRTAVGSNQQRGGARNASSYGQGKARVTTLLWRWDQHIAHVRLHGILGLTSIVLIVVHGVMYTWYLVPDMCLHFDNVKGRPTSPTTTTNWNTRGKENKVLKVM